jgi:hypothetical protein
MTIKFQNLIKTTIDARNGEFAFSLVYSVFSQYLYI